jgi:hypothetical protein
MEIPTATPPTKRRDFLATSVVTFPNIGVETFPAVLPPNIANSVFEVDSICGIKVTSDPQPLLVAAPSEPSALNDKLEDIGNCIPLDAAILI